MTIRYYRYWWDRKAKEQKRKGGQYHYADGGSPLCERYTDRPTARSPSFSNMNWEDVPAALRCQDCVNALDRESILAHC